MRNDNKNNDNKNGINSKNKEKDAKIIYSANKNKDFELKKDKNGKNSKKDIYSSSEKFKSVKPNKKRKKILKIIIMSLLALILFVIGVALFFLLRIKHEKIDVKDLGIDESQIENFSENIVNILVLGIDKNGTSDAILVVSIDNINKNIKLISFLRDSYVEIFSKNGKTYHTKLTEAYGNGGAETTIRTINRNFNLNIKNVITVNFLGMANIIDELGGLDIEITSQEKAEINGIIATTPDLRKRKPGIVKSAGNVHLNGAQVVAYSRIRKDLTIDGQSDDFGRTFRQRGVLQKVYDVIGKTSPSKIPSLINTLLPYVTTSLNFDEIFGLWSTLKNKDYAIQKTSVPLMEYTINPDYRVEVNGVIKSTVYYNLNYTKDLLNKYIYENLAPEDFIKTNPPPKNVGPLDGKNENKENNHSKNSSDKNQKEQQNSSKKYIEQEQTNKKKTPVKNVDKKFMYFDNNSKDNNKTKAKITEMPQSNEKLNKKQEQNSKQDQQNKNENDNTQHKQNNIENETENKKIAKQNEPAKQNQNEPVPSNDLQNKHQSKNLKTTKQAN